MITKNKVLLSLLALFLLAVLIKPVGILGKENTVRNERIEKKNAKVCTAANDGQSVGCHARVVVDNAGRPVTNAVPLGYGPYQLRGAYNLSGTSSSKQIIAVVDAFDDPYIFSDLNYYSNTYGIPTLPNCVGPISSSAVPCFKKVDQNGGTRYPRANSGWALETSLDVEVAHAVCQNCSILLVEASSNSYNNLMAAVDRARLLGAKIISNSYGSGEFSGETSFDSHFNFPGIVFTFSSGDSGYGASYPAASPYVVAVGGTSLDVTGSGQSYSYAGESAWNGSGSGCSAYESIPSFQTADGVCGKRKIADVAADADPSTGVAVYDSFSYFGQKGWFQVGGTSLASPIIAATYALAGNISPSVFGSSVPYGNTSTLYDITTGSNGSCGNYLCNAGTGYDGPTGLGSPNGTGAF